MKPKKIALITGAQRMSFYVSTDSFSPHAVNDCKIETRQYKPGEIALLSPKVANFYSNLHENMKKATFDGHGFQIGPQLMGSMTEYWPIRQPSFSDGEIPAVVYGRTGFIHSQPVKGYFVIALKPGEFIEVEGKNSRAMTKEIIALREQRGMSQVFDDIGGFDLFQRAKGLSGLEEKMRQLFVFDFLMRGRLHELPFDVDSSLFSITEDMLPREAREYLERQKASASR